MNDTGIYPQGLFGEHRHSGLGTHPLHHLAQIEREAGMVTRGVKRYRDKLARAISKGYEDQLPVGLRFLHEMMSCLESKVGELQDRAIEELGTRGKIKDWVPLVCIDRMRLAYLAIRCVFAHRHDADPYDEGDDPTRRPALDLALEVGRQIVRERKFDVWANENGLPGSLCDVHDMVKSWISEHVVRTRNHSTRLRRIKKAVKELARVS